MNGKPDFVELKSQQDASVNFVLPHDDGGFFESRYVTRGTDYFVVYLSSKTGCNLGCRMCHLTATKQWTDTGATVEDYVAQAEKVFAWYDEHGDKTNVKLVHFNWMARADCLDTPTMLTKSQAVFSALDAMAQTRGLVSRFLISTIMPKRMKDFDLSLAFRPIQPEIYYSIYSLDPEFRKKWLPAAMEPYRALEKLADYQQRSRKLLKLHWAFIKGENDSRECVEEICQAVKDVGLHVDVNIVRYNPYDGSYGKEADEEIIEERAEQIRSHLTESKVKVIPRVGYDAKCSCGCFISSG